MAATSLPQEERTPTGTPGDRAHLILCSSQLSHGHTISALGSALFKAVLPSWNLPFLNHLGVFPFSTTSNHVRALPFDSPSPETFFPSPQNVTDAKSIKLRRKRIRPTVVIFSFPSSFCFSPRCRTFSCFGTFAPPTFGLGSATPLELKVDFIVILWRF